VIRTRVGYAGGLMPAPDYGHIGDHTETVQVDYDPRKISYTDLLDIFWRSHSPTERTGSRQYLNVIFYQDEQQRDLAVKSKMTLEQKLGRKVQTQVLPLQTFTWAEDYHQKYLLKGQKTLANELRRIYPHERDFVNSTAAARLNGYVGGQGSPQQLRHDMGRLGLSPEGKSLLDRLVGGKM
jgi:peptide-methionine (S)-S-oxide reductase